MNGRRLRATLAVVALSGIGCGLKSGGYRLSGLGREATLFPPGVRERQSVFQLQFAARARPRPEDCAVAAGAFQLRWRGGALLFLLEETDWMAGGRLRLDAIEDLTQFRAGVWDLERRGCLEAGEGQRLLSRITTHSPLPAELLLYLQYGAFVSGGFLDFTAPMRLEITRPVRTADGEIARAETAAYDVVAGTASAVRLQPSGEDAARILPLANEEGRFRLFFLTRESVADHNFLILFAAVREEIEEATVQLLLNPTDFCSAPLGEADCWAAPLAMGLNLSLPVAVQSRVRFLPIGSRVRDAIREVEGRAIEEDGLAGLRVDRPYKQGRRRVRGPLRALMNLVLIGGERIRW